MNDSEAGTASPRSRTTDFLGDQALLDPADDALGYAPFARKLAGALVDLKPKSGLVLALYGSWGGGKSTMLNFVERDLRELSKADPPAIIRFNPWWFSRQEDLTRAFFDELVRSLDLQSQIDKLKEKSWKTLALLLRVLGKVVSKVPGTLFPAGGEAIPAVAAGVEQLGVEMKDSETQPMAVVKQGIENKLKELKVKVLVIIDDIDRLTADEIRQMFRLIKAVADFSGIIYVVAFDKEIVTAALGTEQVSGEDYLAKIVQIAFDLPLPTRDGLSTMLNVRLGNVLGGTPPELFEPREWSNAYGRPYWRFEADGIGHFIRTPRDVVRLTNYLSLSYPSVKGEVNAVDFVTIETLRLHCSHVYDLIRRNQENFSSDAESSSWGKQTFRSRGNRMPGSGTGFSDEPPTRAPGPPTSMSDLSSSELKRLQDFHQRELRRLEEAKVIDESERRVVERLLVQMFPRLWRVFPPQGDFAPGGDGPVAPSARRLGICFRDRFPFYFRLSPPEGGFSQAEVRTVLREPAAFAAELRKMAEASTQQPADGWSRAPGRSQTLLMQVAENIEAVPAEVAPAMLGAAVRAFDVLSRAGWWSTSLLSGLLSRIDEPQRLPALQDAIDSTPDLLSAISFVARLGGADESLTAPTRVPSEFANLIASDVVETLRRRVAARVEAEAAGDAILQQTRLRPLLSCWHAWGNPRSLKQWGRRVIDTPTLLPMLLAGFLESSPQAPPLPGLEAQDGVADQDRLDPRWLRFFIASDDLVALAKKLSGLSGRQQRAVSALLAAHEQQAKLEQEADPFTD